jgi:3-dehydroquinate synthase
MLRESVDFEGFSSIFVLVDKNTLQHCVPFLKTALNSITYHLFSIEPGEESKNLETCNDIWKWLISHNADRHSLLVSLGGGVVTDIGGFCAGTFMRGMPFLHIPTSLLGMADAAIGGKQGIDFHGFKNYIGIIEQPLLIWIDPHFLLTLDKKELKSGFAEVVKHALIKDVSLFKYIENSVGIEAIEWGSILRKSALIKSSIVITDPMEKGIRKALNFGHTIGHAFESHCLRSGFPLAHGEAVAIGMLAETFISCQLMGLSESTDDIYHLSMKDKKKVGSAIGFTLLDHIGSAVINQPVEEPIFKKAIHYCVSSGMI